MKIELLVKKEYEVTKLLVEARVRYWEDSEVNGIADTEEGDSIPCKIGDLWCPIIDIGTGVIINWKQGVKANIHYKVCDAGEYWLLDENNDKLVKAKGYCVPDFLAIDDSGYGDYIIMAIDENGKIKNWAKREHIEWRIKQFTT